jgi:hypothetical protein
MFPRCADREIVPAVTVEVTGRERGAKPIRLFVQIQQGLPDLLTEHEPRG